MEGDPTYEVKIWPKQGDRDVFPSMSALYIIIPNDNNTYEDQRSSS